MIAEHESNVGENQGVVRPYADANDDFGGGLQNG